MAVSHLSLLAKALSVSLPDNRFRTRQCVLPGAIGRLERRAAFGRGPWGERVLASIERVGDEIRASVEFPSEGAPTVAASDVRLRELNHVDRAIAEALYEGLSRAETTETACRRTDAVFRELPNLLVVGNANLGQSHEFVTPEILIRPDFVREGELQPVIFVRRVPEDSLNGGLAKTMLLVSSITRSPSDVLSTSALKKAVSPISSTADSSTLL